MVYIYSTVDSLDHSLGYISLATNNSLNKFHLFYRHLSHDHIEIVCVPRSTLPEEGQQVRLEIFYLEKGISSSRGRNKQTCMSIWETASPFRSSSSLPYITSSLSNGIPL